MTTYAREIMKQDVERIIDCLLSRHDNVIRREIDYSTCGTRHDHQQMRDAQDDYATAYKASVREILHMIASNNS